MYVYIYMCIYLTADNFYFYFHFHSAPKHASNRKKCPRNAPKMLNEGNWENEEGPQHAANSNNKKWNRGKKIMVNWICVIYGPNSVCIFLAHNKNNNNSNLTADQQAQDACTYAEMPVVPSAEVRIEVAKVNQREMSSMML